jgi:hypothetical protein
MTAQVTISQEEYDSLHVKIKKLKKRLQQSEESREELQISWYALREDSHTFEGSYKYLTASSITARETVIPDMITKHIKFLREIILKYQKKEPIGPEDIIADGVYEQLKEEHKDLAKKFSDLEKSSIEEIAGLKELVERRRIQYHTDIAAKDATIEELRTRPELVPELIKLRAPELPAGLVSQPRVAPVPEEPIRRVRFAVPVDEQPLASYDAIFATRVKAWRPACILVIEAIMALTIPRVGASIRHADLVKRVHIEINRMTGEEMKIGSVYQPLKEVLLSKGSTVPGLAWREQRLAE